MAYSMHTYSGDFRAFKGLIAAQFAGVDVEFNPDFEMGKDNMTKAFKKMSPMGKVPVLETPNGALLESNAIARFLARHAPAAELMGKSFFEQAQVESWLDWCSNELEVPVTMWVYPIFGFMPPNPKQVQKATKETKEALKVLEAHLLSRSFVVGNAVTLADIVMVSTLVYPMKMVFDYNFRKAFPCVTRWFMTCVAMEPFVNVVGDLLLCSKAMELPKGKAKAKKEKKKKGNKPKPAPKPPKDDGKPAYLKYLQKLPRSTFSMDAWKKKYSNCKSEAKLRDAMKWFWENLKQEDYSMWIMEKIDKSADTVDYKLSNSCGGFLQRTDEIRRWTMGVMNILDPEEGSECYRVCGVWLIAGQKVDPFNCNPEISIKPPIYTMTKVDYNDEAQKKWCTDMFCAWDDMGGLPYTDSKVFK